MKLVLSGSQLVMRRCGEAWSLTEVEFSISLLSPTFQEQDGISGSWLSWCNHVRRFIQGRDIFLRPISCLGQWLSSLGGAVPSWEGSRCQVGNPRLVRTRSTSTSLRAGSSLSWALEYQFFCLSREACCSQGGMRDWKIPSRSLSFLEKVALALCNTWISVYLQKIFSSTATFSVTILRGAACSSDFHIPSLP